MGCAVGFRAMLDERLDFMTLDANGILYALYLSARLSLEGNHSARY